MYVMAPVLMLHVLNFFKKLVGHVVNEGRRGGSLFQAHAIVLQFHVLHLI